MSPPAEALAERVTRIESCLQSELGFGRDHSGRLGTWQQKYSRKLQDLEDQVDGGEGLGLRVRVLILWHSYVWVIGIAGVLVGAVLSKLLGL